MVPTRAFLVATAEAMAADTASLGAATALEVHLVTDPFTPGPLTDFSTLNEATFTGSAFKAAGAAPQNSGRDPISDREKVIVKEPAGGWTWACTAAPAEPELITGYCLTSTGGAETWGSDRLVEDVLIVGVGDMVSVGEVAYYLNKDAWE